MLLICRGLAVRRGDLPPKLGVDVRRPNPSLWGEVERVERRAGLSLVGGESGAVKQQEM